MDFPDRHPTTRFIRWRTSLGWSQSDAARALMISQTLVSCIERGEVGVTKLALAKRIQDLSGDWAEGPIRIEEWVEADHPSTVAPAPVGGE